MSNLLANSKHIIERFNTPAIALALNGLIVFAIAWMIWSTVNSTWLSPTASTPMPFKPAAHLQLNQVSSFHLFGNDVSNNTDLPLASLGVNLIGIFKNSNGISRALISTNSSTGDVYQVSDNLAPNVKITKILSQSVIVNHNGRLERLEMSIKPLNFPKTVAQSNLFKKP